METQNPVKNRLFDIGRKWAGEPVLISCGEQWATNIVNGTFMMIGLPTPAFSGSVTYFYGEPKISTACGVIEYDTCEYYPISKHCYTTFVKASKMQIVEAIQSKKLSKEFVDALVKVTKAIAEENLAIA